MSHVGSLDVLHILTFARYTPQAPTALSNGPTIIEAQVETIVDMVTKLEKENVKSIEPQKQAEADWKELCNTMMNHTLIPQTDSWWNGANIPGKKAESMIYVSASDFFKHFYG